MAGFKLIQNYLSDSDDDADMSCNSTSNNNKNFPLPSNLLSWMTDDSEIKEDPDKHDGRIRSFKHERGNWATFVYIKYQVWDLLEEWMKSSTECLTDGNLIIENSHISLTRTLIFKFHWIESFVDSMKKICSSVSPFTLEINNVRVYCNEERTRTFLGIECHCQEPGFIHLMESLNELLAEYQLESFYQEASYHISFFWMLGDREKELKPHVEKLNDSLNQVLIKDLNKNYIKVSKLHCKIGNKIYIFTLKS
ncbi:U6 snRNA phosphodiesterase 1 [Microplitis demolitor]|uniref:U6 snRNA phosphodiesterase 1 n=1 Tax=Microplitis demolitor TaxID=69319 RepID=UPI0004CCC80C|nr:U6 snRNA phosphodiesterase 1 [Microplitis demolitor]